MCKDNIIFYWYGASILILNDFTSTMHSHYPVEIYVGLDDILCIKANDNLIKSKAIVINSNYPHQLDSSNGNVALILLNPNLYRLNKHNCYSDIDCSIVDDLIKTITVFYSNNPTLADAKNLINNILSTYLKENILDKSVDSRISLLLTKLEDIPYDKIYSKDLASYIGLSESHLVHLFKEQTGTNIHKYILWIRLRKAIKLILQGNSFTTAAHESGFSDSAHLSRTYRNMFGVTPTEILKYKEINYNLNYK